MVISNDFISRVSALMAARGPTSPAPLPEKPTWSNMYEAAAVVTVFDPQGLPTSGVLDAEEERKCLLADATPVGGQDARPQWVLDPSVRVAVLRQLRQEKRAVATLKLISPRPKGDLQKALEGYLLGTAKAVAAQSLEEVTASHQVCQWLREAGFPDIPPDQEFRQRADWFELLAPCLHLVGKHFRGRNKELRALRDYVGVLPPGTILESARRTIHQIFNVRTQPPLLIHGPGGVGKSTLLSRFILDHVEALETDRFPFIYLDFDRPDIDAHEPLSLLLEALRQLGIEYPEARINCENLATGWRKQIEDNVQTESIEVASAHSSNRRRRVQNSMIQDFASLVNTIGAADRPVVLILDTFEEVQWRSEILVDAVWDLLENLQAVLPRLRCIVAGRADLPSRETKQLLLTELDSEAAVGYLQFRGVKSLQDAERIVHQVGGSPMTLLLAADLYLREGVNSKGELSVDTRDYFFFKIGQEQIQRQLYKRVLSHIHDPEIVKLAHPGLILRRITPELILKVLAKPCGLAVNSPEGAELLFKELRREVSLVSPDGMGGLRHRTDLRRLMASLLESDDREKATAIHGAAVAYYESKQTSPIDRAEEIYHRLCLSQDFKDVSKRWIPGLDRYLESAVPEFSGARKAWLASRLRLPVDAETERLAEIEDWERLIEQKVKELLAVHRATDARELLKEREERTANSPLFQLEALVLARLYMWQESLTVLQRGFSSAAGGDNRRLALELSLQASEVVLVGRQDEAAPKILRDLMALRDTAFPPLDRLRLLVHAIAVQNLTQAESIFELESSRREWRLLFDELQDEQLKTDAKLGLWLMMVLDADDSNRLARLIRIFGIPDGGDRALHALGYALTEFDRRTTHRISPKLDALLGDVVDSLAGTVDVTDWSQLILNNRRSLSAPLATLLEGFTEFIDQPLLDAFSAAARAGLGVDVSDEAPEMAGYAPATSSKSLRLTGKDLAELRSATLESFSRNDLEQFLLFNFDRRLDSLAISDASLSETVLSMIQAATNEGWLPQFVTALVKARPNRADLQAFADRMGLSTVASSHLESVVGQPLIDVGLHRSRLNELESQVCRLEVDGELIGTGFLIGPDLVLTADHLISSIRTLRGLSIRFDRQLDLRGKTLNRGTLYRLSRQPILFRSDESGLDCAVLSVLDSPGIQPVSAQSHNSPARLRGWIRLPWAEFDPKQSPEISILYYGRRGSLQLATGSLPVVRAPGKRMNFSIETETETEAEASGAPFLDDRSQAIAMATGQHKKGLFGVSLYLIRQRLEKEGLTAKLDSSTAHTPMLTISISVLETLDLLSVLAPYRTGPGKSGFADLVPGKHWNRPRVFELIRTKDNDIFLRAWPKLIDVATQHAVERVLVAPSLGNDSGQVCEYRPKGNKTDVPLTIRVRGENPLSLLISEQTDNNPREIRLQIEH